MLDQVISHYRIIQKLGAGGMGVVYKAEDLTLGRTVALKFLPNEVAVSENDKESLLREARAACALDHPNIGVIHGLEESADQQLFIVMGYYEGETLSEKLNRGVISVRDSLDYAIQVAKGLSAAHSRNIVHRDIKPSNIIITKENVAKIVDFGLARVVATASATQSVSNTGTLPYMAPEQILGEAVDQRADVWALGVVIVQMLTGSHPFLRPNTAAMSFAILNQPPAAVDAVPAPVQPIVFRALSKQASHRYASAEEMARDLETARAHITATPMPLDEPTVTRSLTPKEVKRYIENAATPRWGTSRWPLSYRLLIVAGMLVAVLGVWLAPSLREHVAGLVYAYAGGEKHIAVLPFVNSRSDPDYQPVAEGLMDSVTNDLSNLEAAQQSLWVVPASVVRGNNVSDPTSAFHKLGATIVVEGRIERRGPAVNLTINLIDSKHLRQIGSARLTDGGGDLGMLETQTVHYVAQAMRVKVSEDALRASAGVPPSSYESYIKALGYLQRFDKPGNIDLAISAVSSAVRDDPGFALGYATLGEAYRLKYQTDHRPEWLEQAAENCQKAVQVDPRVASAHVTLGRIDATRGKNDSALQEFQRALDLDPRNSDAIRGTATVHEALGQLADAEASYKGAIALRPDYWGGYASLGAFYYNQQRYSEAIAQFQRVVELTPDNPVAYSNLGNVYSALDDGRSQAAAETAFRKSIQLGPNYEAFASLGLLYSGQKKYSDAIAMLQKALELNDGDWRVWAYLLETYQWVGDEDKLRQTRLKAVALLEKDVAVNSKDPLAESALGLYYGQDHQREKALLHANAALKLAPKDTTVLTDVAEMYEELGERKKALQFAEQSVKNGSTLASLQDRRGLQALLSDTNFAKVKSNTQ
jgi:eukaryotic-like serine/threonine-protein kinase